MNRMAINRLARLEERQRAGVVVIDLCSDGTDTQADLDKANAGGQRIILLVDDTDGDAG